MKTANDQLDQINTVKCDARILGVQQLRYKVYAAEMGMDLPGVDHARKLFSDPMDFTGEHVLAVRGETVAGAVRLNVNEVPAGMEGALAIDSLAKPFVYCSRFCILPERRGGTLVNALIDAAFRKFEEYGARVAVCHCYQHLMGLYMRRGFRAYGAPFVVKGLEHLGAQIPLLCSLTTNSAQQAA